jgi:hypothetical protein
MDGATFMGNAGIPCVPRPISRHSVVTGITDRAYLPAYEKPYRPLPALLLTLALMCENVNAAPAVVHGSAQLGLYKDTGTERESLLGPGPQVAAPFNAAPQVAGAVRPGAKAGADNVNRHVPSESSLRQAHGTNPAVAAPFTLSHPLCGTGFMLLQRFDTRDRFGIIVKREWKMTGCAKGRIVYGRKV